MHGQNTTGFMVPYFVDEDERIESKGTHERRLRKMRNRSLFLPQLCLLNENMWSCKEGGEVVPSKLAPLPCKKMKDSRPLITP